MTRDNYQQFWYTGEILIPKLHHYFTVSVNPKKHFGGFEIIPNSRDTAPECKVYISFIINGVSNLMLLLQPIFPF